MISSRLIREPTTSICRTLFFSADPDVAQIRHVQGEFDRAAGSPPA